MRAQTTKQDQESTNNILHPIPSHIVQEQISKTKSKIKAEEVIKLKCPGQIPGPEGSFPEKYFKRNILPRIPFQTFPAWHPERAEGFSES